LIIDDGRIFFLDAFHWLTYFAVNKRAGVLNGRASLPNIYVDASCLAYSIVSGALLSGGAVTVAGVLLLIILKKASIVELSG
jgi:hypothetical protein